VKFIHRNGAYGESCFRDHGRGVAIIDVAATAARSHLWSNSGSWPWRGGGVPPTLALYLNDGKGAVPRTHRRSGLDTVRLYGMGIAVGDFDNDGSTTSRFTGVGRRGACCRTSGQRQVRGRDAPGRIASAPTTGTPARPSSTPTTMAPRSLPVPLRALVAEIDRAIDFA